MSSQVVRRVRASTEATDPDRARDLMVRTRHAMGVEVEAGPAPFRFAETIVRSDSLALESTSCSGTVSGVVRTGEQLVVTWMKSGRGSIGEHRAPVGRPILFHPEAEPFRWTAFELDTLRIDRGIVQTVAAERGGWEPQPLAFEPHHVPEGATLAAWWLMVRQVAADVIAGPAEVSADHDRRLTRAAAGGLLTAIPHWPVGAAGRAPATARLARAETFLLEHVQDPIGVEDVARAAGMSERGLQSAFRRAHASTPMAYLRRIRLQMARDLLRDAAVGSVAEAAGRVAIPHLGRFAAAYRAEFGELPGATLRAARDED